jgi:hypothetical protein
MSVSNAAFRPPRIGRNGPWLPRRPLTLDGARKWLAWANSYQRLPSLLRLCGRPELSREDILTLLGEIWSMCDNIGPYSQLIGLLLPDGPCPQMMTEQGRTELSLLPSTVAVYRGADRGVNEQGLSWSLDRDVASRFPFLARYLADTPVLVSGTVAREKIAALMLDRGEREVVVNGGVTVLSVEVLPGPRPA